MTSLEVSCVQSTDPQPSASQRRVALLPLIGTRNAKASGVTAGAEYGGWSEHLQAGKDVTARAGAALPSLAALHLWYI